MDYNDILNRRYLHNNRRRRTTRIASPVIVYNKLKMFLSEYLCPWIATPPRVGGGPAAIQSSLHCLTGSSNTRQGP